MYSKRKKRKYNLGGENLGQALKFASPFLNMIPGVGSIAAPLAGALGSQLMQSQTEPVKPIQMPIPNRNQWNFSHGGPVNKTLPMSKEESDLLAQVPRPMPINIPMLTRENNGNLNRIASTIAPYLDQFNQVISPTKIDSPYLQHPEWNLKSNVSFAYGGEIYEAEGEEMIQHSQDIPMNVTGNIMPMSNSMSMIKGNSHENGGVTMSGGDRIYSNRLKVPGAKFTFAQKAARLSKVLDKLEKGDVISKRTAGMYKVELDKLFDSQESLKTNRLRGKKKFYGGGNTPNQSDYDKVANDMGFSMTTSESPVTPESILDIMYSNFKNRPNVGNPNVTNVAPMSTQLPMPDTRGLGDRNLPYIEETQAPNLGQLYNPNMGSHETPNIPDTVNTPSNRTMQAGSQGLMGSGVPNMPQTGSEVGSDIPWYDIARYAPVGYNFGQALLTGLKKPDYYQRTDNPQYTKALKEIDQSKEYDISDILASNRAGYNSMLNNSRIASGGSGANYMSYAMNVNRAKRRADAEAYSTKNRFVSDANARAANMRFNMGEAERQEDRYTQLNRMQTDANKRNVATQYLTAGVNDLSQGVQSDRLMDNQQATNDWMFKLLNQFFPEMEHYDVGQPATKAMGGYVRKYKRKRKNAY